MATCLWFTGQASCRLGGRHPWNIHYGCGRMPQSGRDTAGGRDMKASDVSDGRDQPGVMLLVVRPHPDDESSATGGMLAYYQARGVRTGVVICTGGEEGEIHDPTLDPVADRPRLRAIREQELRHACALLGVAELRMLGYRDSGMPGTPANQQWDAFAQAAPGEAVGRLVRIIRGLRPHVIVTEP